MKKAGSYLGIALFFLLVGSIQAAIINVPGPYGPTIQAAITAAQPGDTIQVAPGTYVEKVVINKYVILEGAGSGNDPGTNTIIAPTSGTCINILGSGNSAANPIIIRNLRTTGGQDGIYFGGTTLVTSINHVLLDNVYCIGASDSGLQIELGGSADAYTITVSDLTIRNSSFNNNSSMGFRVSKRGIVDGLVVYNCHFDNNLARGWYAQFVYPTWSTNITNVHMSYTTFNNNANRGWFLEKLENAEFDHIIVMDNGTVSDANAAGLDVNLKYKAYQNISIRNSRIINNGSGNTNNRGTGIYIKARDDSPSYSTYPATLKNVTIENTEVSGSHIGIGIGEFGTNSISSPSNVIVQNCCIHANSVAGLVVYCQPIVNADNNWWGASDGPSAIGLGSGDHISTNATYDPWLVGVSYTGEAAFGPADHVILKAKVASSSGVTTGVLVQFFAGGTFVGSGLADLNGIASFDWDVQPVGAYSVYATAGGGCLSSATKTISVVNALMIAASAGTNGSISPAGDVSVNYGASQTFAITPNTGYHVSDVLVDGSSVGAVTSYTLNNVTAAHTISASFEKNKYTITPSVVGGTINPPSAVTVEYGGSQAFAYAPTTGYHIVSVSIDGTAITPIPASPYPFTNVTANHTIAVTFGINTYTITATAGANGSITPSGSVSVNYNSSQTFNITAYTGYVIDEVVVDGTALDATPSSYPFSNVTANHTISVTFAAKMRKLDIERFKIDFSRRPTDDQIYLKGSLDLGKGASKLKAGVPVTLTINDKFDETITMTAKWNGSTWVYRAPRGKDGIIEMTIEWRGTRANFEVRIDDVEMGSAKEWKNPVDVSLQIDGYIGFDSVRMNTHKDWWDCSFGRWW